MEKNPGQTGDQLRLRAAARARASDGSDGEAQGGGVNGGDRGMGAGQWRRLSKPGKQVRGDMV
jgi:hypothetical protein